ncbi:MAG: DoxX family protein [Verrucomicrobiae bacterium]|nr:DoxX family protein [Verrucomicrobiae bacterium]
MKYIPHVAGGLLGLLFVMSGLVVLLKLVPNPPLPEGTPAAHFMAAFVPTGYLAFVKVFEVIGGILVAIPRTRNLGLLVLGPILVNILAFHVFVTGGKDLANPMLILIVLIALYLLWVERAAFAGLVAWPRKTGSASVSAKLPQD